MPNTFTIEEASMYCLVNASMQYKFWTISKDSYQRYAKDGKSGAILMTNLLAEKLIPLFNHPGHKIPFLPCNSMSSFISTVDDFPNSYNLIRSETIINFFNTTTITISVADLAKAILKENRVTVHMAKCIANRFPSMFADPYLKKAQLALFKLDELK